MWWKFGAFLLFVNFLSAASSATILALFSSLNFADHEVFRGYVSLLTQRGYSVVLMTPYPGHFQHPEIEKIVEIDVSQESAKYWEEYKKLITNVDDYYPIMKPINDLSLKVAIAQLKSKQMTDLLVNPNVKFDLVVTEADVPLLYAIADKYNAPHISITTSTGKLHQYEAKGNPTHPLLYPDVNCLHYRKISFWQKINEILRHVQTKREYMHNYLRLSQIAAEKILGLKRDLQEVEKDIDVLLVASNPLLIGNRPNVPAVAYVDGMHIKPGMPLPQDLQSILNSATKGVIYFSLGTVQDSEQLAPQMLQTLADAFSELPYLVLWKIGNTTMFKKPDNVLAHPWFPQQGVLEHPNVKAFITHGGQRSLEEAIFYSVPIIGFPIVKSRRVFIEEVTRHGAGEVLDPYYLDKQIVKNTVSLVASNDKYQNAVAMLKDKVEDTGVSGPDHALLWTDVVLRNGDAQHLWSPTAGCAITTYFMIDILLALLIGVVFLICSCVLIIKLIIKFIRVRFLRKQDSGKFKTL